MGRKISWKYGKGTYSGTVMKTTKDKIYARTKNGKTKVIHRNKKKK